MSALTEFLLARIAEDEARLPEGFDCWYEPERYAIECEAKRRIVEIHVALPVARWFYCSECDPGDEYGDHNRRTHPCPTLRALAAVYANHPDYREEWAS